jgi:hypothetical protein
VPRLYGRHRVFPTLAAHPYTEVEGSDQYFRMLFDVSYGPLLLSDLRIGAVPLAQYEGVDTEIRPTAVRFSFMAFARLVRANLMHRRRIDHLLTPPPAPPNAANQLALQWP